MPLSRFCIIGEPLLPRISLSRSSGTADTCFRTVVQLPRVMTKDHLPRVDPPVGLIRLVTDFRNDGSQIREGGFLAALCPVAFKSICVTGARGIGVHMVSLRWSDQMRRRLRRRPPSSVPTRATTVTRCTRRRHTECSNQHATHIPVPFQGKTSTAILAREEDLQVC